MNNYRCNEEKKPGGFGSTSSATSTSPFECPNASANSKSSFGPIVKAKEGDLNSFSKSTSNFSFGLSTTIHSTNEKNPDKSAFFSFGFSSKAPLSSTHNSKKITGTR